MLRPERPPKKLKVPLPAWQASSADWTSVRDWRDFTPSCSTFLSARVAASEHHDASLRKAVSMAPMRWPGCISNGRTTSLNSLAQASAVRLIASSKTLLKRLRRTVLSCSPNGFMPIRSRACSHTLRAQVPVSGRRACGFI